MFFFNRTCHLYVQVGMIVDEEGFHAEMALQKARSKEAAAARRLVGVFIGCFGTSCVLFS